MSLVQYRLASRCTEVQADRKAAMTIKRVKVDKDDKKERPEESPLVVVE